MAEEKGVVTETEAKMLALKFLLIKYPQARVNFSGIQLINMENEPVYLLQGQITMHSRSGFDRFFFSTPPRQYSFKVELDATRKRIIHYELD